MRFLFLLTLTAASAGAQSFGLGIKAGVPLTDFFNTVSSQRFSFNAPTRRYIVGGTAELRLPAGLGIELDALYRRLNYDGSGNLVDVFLNNRTRGNAWEFPLLLKYRVRTPLVSPFADIGVAWDTLTGFRQSITRTIFPSRMTSSESSSPMELRKRTTTGFVIGGGLDIHALFLHVSPEIRYTRWGSEHFQDASGLLHSNRNQAEFLVGFTF